MIYIPTTVLVDCISIIVLLDIIPYSHYNYIIIIYAQADKLDDQLHSPSRVCTVD